MVVTIIDIIKEMIELRHKKKATKRKQRIK